MRKLMLAGAVALVALGSPAVLAADATDGGQTASGFVVTDGQIAQFKTVLKLSADQERYWVPIEATLHDIARRQNTAAATLDVTSLRRLISAAMPLFRRLDAEQKRDAMALARALGISSLASAF
jgi:aminopeptidase N